MGAKRVLNARLLTALLIAALMAVAGVSAWSAHETLAYAKDIGKKNEQACKECEAVRAGTAPAGYTDVLGNKAVYRGGTARSGLQNGTSLDDDSDTFASPLPYGDTYIDVTRIRWTATSTYIIDIPEGSPFHWVATSSAGASLRDANGRVPETDPMGQKKGISKWVGQEGRNTAIAYVGPLKGFHDNFTDAASETGNTNEIKASDYNVPYLYKIVYPEAVTLPSGVRGNLVIIVDHVDIETTFTVDEDHPRILKAEDGSSYTYTEAIVAVQNGNSMAASTAIIDGEGNYITQDLGVAKTADEVRAQLAGKVSQPNIDASSQDKMPRGATGVHVDIEVQVTDVDGKEVEGTISYSAYDLDLMSYQNVWGRKSTGDDRLEFAEGLEIVSGSQSYALVPEYNHASGTTLNTGWVPVGPYDAALSSPLNITGGGGPHADGTNFRSIGIVNYRDKDGTWDKALFNVSNNANDAQTMITFPNGVPWNENGQLTAPYTSMSPKWQVYAQLGLPSTATGADVFNLLGDGSWATERADDDTFDTGFAVLLDAKSSKLRWSGSASSQGTVVTTLFDTTLFTYIEQTHGTGGGIYLESYKINDECKPVAKEGVVTMGRGAEATVTAVPEEGYRIKEFQIGGAGLKSPKTYTLKDLGLTPGTAGTKTVDGITFEMNADGTVDVTFTDVQDPRHIHVDFTADYYFYKIWKGDEEPTKLELTAVPYAYIFTDVTLPVQTDIDAEGHAVYTDTHFSINGTEYTADDGTKYVLNANNTLETVAKDAGGNPLVTLPQVLKGNEFVGTDDTKYPVTVQFGVNFAMGNGTDPDSVKQTFTVANETKYANYVTVLEDGGDISRGNEVWKIRYPAEGVESLGWPALPIETEPAAHNANHVERNYWFVTEEAPAGWSKEGYDNSAAEAPGVVPTIEGEHAGYYDNHVWAAASVKDYVAATAMIQQENKTKNAFMSVFSKDANTTKTTYGGEISNVPAVVVKGEKTWVDFKNQFNTRQDIWLHIDAVVDGKVVTKDILPPQKLAADATDETQTVTWGDMEVYETDQENVEIITNLADIPLADEHGQRVTYEHKEYGSYEASNGITYWLNELVKVDANGKTITYVVRETLDAAGTQPVEKDKEAEGLVGYTAAADEVNATELEETKWAMIGDVAVLTYEGKLKNELALTDVTVTKIWDDAPATEHGDDVDPDKLKAAWTLYESDAEVTDEGDLKLQPAAAVPYVKSSDDEVGTLEAKNGSEGGKVTTTFTWHNIPKYVGDGTTVHEAVYSVKETQLENYELPVYSDEDKALNEGTVTNTQNPPTPKDDETWGLKGEEQTGEPSFEKGTADIDTNTIKLIDPATGKPTDEKTVDALDAEGNKIGTYTLNGDGTVTFKPNDDFVGDPQPAKLRATDKNGFEVDAKYQPHVIDDTETEDVSRTIHYIYSTDGSEASADLTQTATFTRKATGLDPDTHEPIWGDWELTETIADVKSPEIDGWNPSSELVTGFPELTYDTKDQVKDVTVVYSPNPPEGSHKATFGPKGATQKGTPPFTKGTGEIKKYELIDGEGNVVDKLPAYDSDGNEVGTYTIDTTTGEVTFTPTDPDFVGTPTSATVRATDEYGETATGTYTPTTVENTETESVTKTITHVYEDGTPVLGTDGNPLVSTQTLGFSRVGEVNPDTGEITWPAWGNQTFDDWDAPDVEGYTPHKAKSTGETVTGTSGDIEDQIVYKRDTFTVVFTNGSNGKSDGNGDQTGVPYGEDAKGGNTVTPDEGYKFTGKYTYVITKKDGTTETGETDDPTSVAVTGNVVFTPLYEKLPTVTYIDPATGRVIQVTTPFNEDGTEPTPPDPPTRPGFTFNGWDREVDADGNVTYKAKWTAWKYTLKYDANGGSGSMDAQNFTGEDSSAVSSSNSFTRDGYKFTGFKAKLPDGSYLKDANGNDMIFTSTADFMDYFLEYGDGSEITLVAQWEPVSNPSPKNDGKTPSTSGTTPASTAKTADSAPLVPLSVLALLGLAGIALGVRLRLKNS